jgi:cell division protein FtsB
MRQNLSLSSIFFSKTAVVLLLLGAIFLIRSQFLQYKKRSVINDEIKKLQNQELALTQKNQELQESLEALNGSSFKEKIGREQLNLKKDGEIVVSYNDNNNNNDQQKIETPPKKAGGVSSRVVLWWNYFFKN